LLDAYETHIANFFLSAFPQPISWEDLLDKIEKEADEVLIWEPFEDFDRDNVIRWMEESKSSLMGSFVPINVLSEK